MQDVKVLIIAGPTASGKTSLAIELAQKHGGEVISADSRQVYKTLDIGTEKVTKEEMQGIPHHLIDVVEPEEVFSVQQFQKLAREKIAEIHGRGKLPILAGGSGQYIDAAVYDVSFPQVPPNEILRRDLEELPGSALFKLLEKLDPRRAETIDPHNKQRLVRALEIVDALGAVPPQQDPKPLYDLIYLGIDVPRDELRERISARLEITLEKGLIEEVENVRARVGDARLNEFGLEYRVVRDFLDGKIENKEKLREKLCTELMQYAKRQMTWFKRNADIQWLSREEIIKYAANLPETS